MKEAKMRVKDKKTKGKEYRYLTWALAAASLLLFVLAALAKKTPLTVLCAVLAAGLLVGSGILFYKSYKLLRQSNFFLYDRRHKRAISEKELNFAFVNDCLDYYLADFAEKPVDLWAGIPKELYIKLQAEPIFRTPVAFKMMYELSLLSPEEVADRFDAADERTVAAVCRAVKAGGDLEMADLMFQMKRNFAREGQRVPPFFIKNKRCFEGRIMRFVKEHLTEFQTD